MVKVASGLSFRSSSPAHPTCGLKIGQGGMRCWRVVGRPRRGVTPGCSFAVTACAVAVFFFFSAASTSFFSLLRRCEGNRVVAVLDSQVGAVTWWSFKPNVLSKKKLRRARIRVAEWINSSESAKEKCVMHPPRTVVQNGLQTKRRMETFFFGWER